MYNTNQSIKEEENGLKCLWVYNSGEDDSQNDDEEEEQMWNSLSSIPDVGREQEEVEAIASTQTTPIQEPEKRVSKRALRPSSFHREQEQAETNVNNSVSSALQRRARLRHSDKQKRESRAYRRSLVKSSVLSLSQRHLDIDSSSSHETRSRTTRRVSMM